ncbi:MAG: potassium-transporting ATPase subunit KdpA [Gemmatimonadales bacterium]
MLAWGQLALFLTLLLVLAWPVGGWIVRVYGEERLWSDRIFGAIERALYRAAGVDPSREMPWHEYGLALLAFSAAGIVTVYLLQRVQGVLPFNPAHLGGVSPPLAFNTAVSFVTNTNWQAYGGETTLTHLTQAGALTVQNFVSAASGLAVLMALIRGLSRKSAATIGNFWRDLVRGTLHLLLPLATLLALLLVSQGVVQSWSGPRIVPRVAATPDAPTQTIALGPVASQEAIKELGTNGGGFFNANSAHPFENPTPLSDLFETLAILLLPTALCLAFGRMVGDRRQGWALLATMLVLIVPLMVGETFAESGSTPALVAAGAAPDAGNLEGKELRFGIPASARFTVITTATSCGAVNTMHDSLTPLGGLIPLWLIQLGEVVFGGVGSGLYGMLLFVLLAVFIAGLMVGRTPEYLGKKIGAFEIKMATVAILVPAAAVLVGTAVAVVTDAGRAGVLNPGPHGFSEVLYAFSSAANNNGSAFAGLSADSWFYDLLLAAAMFVGRFWVAIPVLAIAGSLARKTPVAPSAGTLPTHGPLFVSLLAATILLIGALTFLPALALGPIVEHLLLLGAR